MQAQPLALTNTGFLQSGAAYFDKNLWQAFGFFALSFLMVFYEMPVALKGLLVLGMLAFQLTSYVNNVTIMAITLFFVYFENFLNTKILSPDRVCFVIFFIMSLQVPTKRTIKFHPWLLALIIVSLLSIKVTSDIQMYLQKPDDIHFKTQIGWWYDLFARLCFLYFVFTKLSYRQINYVFTLLMFLGLFHALGVLYMAILKPAVLMGKHVDLTYLWNSRVWAHKNLWGTLMLFMLFIAMFRNFNKKNPTIVEQALPFIMGACLVVSLSRQAYFFLLVGFILVMMFKTTSRITLYFLIGMMLLLIIQPDFLMNRIDSMLTATSVEELQATKGEKFAAYAVPQFISNLTFLPQMFFTDFQYNYSEGFWNGLLHQQGLGGAIFTLYLLIHLMVRAFQIWSMKDKRLTNYGALALITYLLMTFTMLNRRTTYFIGYKRGKIIHMGLVLLFMVCYIELLYHSIKNKEKHNFELM